MSQPNDLSTRRGDDPPAYVPGGKPRDSPREAQRRDARRLALARAADYAALLQTRSPSRRGATLGHRRQLQPRRQQRQRDVGARRRSVAVEDDEARVADERLRERNK